MAKIMDPILPLLSILGYWSIVLGSFGGPGRCFPVGPCYGPVGFWWGLFYGPRFCIWCRVMMGI